MRSTHRIAEEWLRGAKAYHMHRFCGMWLAVLVLVLAAVIVRADDDVSPTNTLAPFSTDGCSWFPEGPVWAQSLWRHCCAAHDLAYWKGGDYMARMIADDALRECVADQGEPVTGLTMLVGVRLGGSPYWPTEFRWGYGWQNPRGYSPLNPSELKQVEMRLQEQNLLSQPIGEDESALTDEPY